MMQPLDIVFTEIGRGFLESLDAGRRADPSAVRIAARRRVRDARGNGGQHRPLSCASIPAVSFAWDRRSTPIICAGFAAAAWSRRRVRSIGTPQPRLGRRDRRCGRLRSSAFRASPWRCIERPKAAGYRRPERTCSALKSHWQLQIRVSIVRGHETTPPVCMIRRACAGAVLVSFAPLLLAQNTSAPPARPPAQGRPPPAAPTAPPRHSATSRRAICSA